MELFSEQTLFDNTDNSLQKPLAELLRPKTLDEIVGQTHIVGDGKVLSVLLNQGKIPSLILWGPPGSGKTTIARLIAQHTQHHFVEFSAVTSGIADIKKVVEEAKTRHRVYGQQTIIFIDEIHRFNKSQQDAFLPHVEAGVFTLIGATTENPSFSINSALLSRCRVLVLQPLAEADLQQVLLRAVEHYKSIGVAINWGDGVQSALINISDGDARRLLTALEMSVLAYDMTERSAVQLTVDSLKQALQHKHLHYDKSGEEHYNIISALHKSLRDSDPNGTVYWLARMLEAGEDPMFVARRLVRAAAEDVGLADPQALVVAQAGMNAVEKIGMPESNVILAEVAIYLARAPKSNAVYTAYNQAKADVAETTNEPVPLHLRNGVTGLMKEAGYGKNYQYAHDAPDAKVDQQHLPDRLQGKVYYRPTNRGREAEQSKS